MSVTFSAYVSSASNPAWIASELNITNNHFYGLMTLIGMENAECCGSLTDYALLKCRTEIQCVLSSLKALPMLDGGTPTETTKGSNGAEWIDCGLPEGYYQQRLTTLLEIINAAIAQGGTVVWG